MAESRFRRDACHARLSGVDFPGMAVANRGLPVAGDQPKIDASLAPAEVGMIAAFGAGTVLGTFVAAVGMQLPVNLVVIAAAVENAIDGNAYRPSDVITSMSGKTIEVGNTDAEGRLILCDALTYAPVSYTHLRAHETVLDIVCRLLLEKKKHSKHTHTP